MTEMKDPGGDGFWQRILETAAASMGDRMRTEHLVFQSFDGRTLKLAVDRSGADIARYLSRETDKLIDLVKRATGQIVRIELDRGAVEAAAPASVKPPDALEQVRRSPLVQKAIELFDATIVSVEKTPDSPP